MYVITVGSVKINIFSYNACSDLGLNRMTVTFVTLHINVMQLLSNSDNF